MAVGRYRYHYLALLIFSMLLYFISNQLFYQNLNVSNINILFKNSSLLVTEGKRSSSVTTSVVNIVSKKNSHNNNSLYTFSNLINDNDNSNNRKKVGSSIELNTDFINQSQSNNTTRTNNPSTSTSDNTHGRTPQPRAITVDVKYSKSVVTVKENRSQSKVSSSSVLPAHQVKEIEKKRTERVFNTTGNILFLDNKKGGSRNSRDKARSSSPVETSGEVAAVVGQQDWFQIFKDTASKVYNLFSSDHLSEFRKWAVEKTREFIKHEMKGYKFLTPNRTLNNYVLEKGGQPIRNVIFTTWRSGSTFLGEILDSHPGTYYHYEPLLHFQVVQARSGPLAEEAVRVVRELLNCNYKNLTAYMKNGETQHWVFNHNSRVWNFCETNHQVCWDPNFLSSMCRIFPFQALKTVRMRLKLARSLLKDPKLNIRLLHLVRDPRGTIQSRFHRDWCPNNPDCENPAILCSDLLEDYYEAQKLRKEHPDRFMVVRYEDMAINIYAAVKKIFKFFRLEYHPRVNQFLDVHTKSNMGGVSSTYRDTKAAPFHWMQDMAKNFTTVEKIQKSCRKALDVWGYNAVGSAKQLLDFNPVKKPPWSDMIIPSDSSS